MINMTKLLNQKSYLQILYIVNRVKPKGSKTAENCNYLLLYGTTCII